MVARGREGRLGETVTTEGLCSAATSVGRGTLLCVDLAQPKDEQRLREAVCERRSVRICCHESPHAEAVSSCLRLFHTVSEGEFSEVEGAWRGVFGGSPTAGVVGRFMYSM